jgi:anti-sigma factor ChrR (cupin superfamily)
MPDTATTAPIPVTPNLEGQENLEPLASRYVDVESLPWTPTDTEGIDMKVLMRDAANGRWTALIRWQPGASLPLHEHTDIEQSYILEGSLCDHEGEATAGQFVWRPAGSRHRAHAPNGAVLLAVFLAPNKFLEGDRAEGQGD